jgi:hypothetical protein
MNDILKLKQLLDLGIPMTVLARECHCSPASIQNYINGKSIPSGTKALGIKEGLRHFTDKINSITRE